jgi:HK97 family phage portal protein
LKRQGLLSRAKQALIGDWVDRTVAKSFDFSGWQNRHFWGIENATLETNETIFAAISRLSSTMSSLPIKLYQNFNVVNNNVSDLLTSSPNNSLTSYDFINRIETMRNEKGNAYVFIERDVYYTPVKLHLMNPDVVVPVIEGNSKELYYIINGEKGGQVAVHNLEMMHFKHIVGSSSMKGISPINVLKNTTSFDKSVREFNLKEMEKPDSFILKYGANVDTDTRKQIIEDFKRFYTDNGGILFQEPGVEIEALSKKYVSEDVVASENLTRSRVANVFQMPLAFLNGEKGLNFSKNEDLNRHYVQHTLLPICKQYEEEFNRKLLTKKDRLDGLYFKFNVKALLRGDSATQAEVFFKAVRSGYYTINEIRALEDLPPVENGDTPLISGDLYPLGMTPEERTGKGGDEIE